MIIVACNTATTNAIQKIRERVSVPVIGIEPGIKPAINYTKTIILEFCNRKNSE